MIKKKKKYEEEEVKNRINSSLDSTDKSELQRIFYLAVYNEKSFRWWRK